jgi:hypothetical protein
MSLQPQHEEDNFVTNPATGVLDFLKSKLQGAASGFAELQFYVAHVRDGIAMDLHRIVG